MYIFNLNIDRITHLYLIQAKITSKLLKFHIISSCNHSPIYSSHCTPVLQSGWVPTSWFTANERHTAAATHYTIIPWNQSWKATPDISDLFFFSKAKGMVYVWHKLTGRKSVQLTKSAALIYDLTCSVGAGECGCGLGVFGNRGWGVGDGKSEAGSCVSLFFFFF